MTTSGRGRGQSRWSIIVFGFVGLVILFVELRVAEVFKSIFSVQYWMSVVHFTHSEYKARCKTFGQGVRHDHSDQLRQHMGRLISYLISRL